MASVDMLNGFNNHVSYTGGIYSLPPLLLQCPSLLLLESVPTHLSNVLGAQKQITSFRFEPDLTHP